ncbi:Bet v1-like protein [Saitoella complicata NRRL Y-17804]|uniref:Bet v1-like protein n=1 Tax=Saitoella complicata (strain BCRC 22490 / CBS 7301 / JCM 7358 / NBRC 10748 / NRRL Y-17804) TaxID=698492 RepID=UPI000866B606|nr:Bet v1-like protein [Saitoella complicata NRRL Y-17804]ODQ55986.1 Bet v1-like protein [Saitoella complicata NRRL Y-17804]
MPIPTSTGITESAVIPAPLASVWHLIKLGKFADFWSALKSSSVVKDTSEETDIYKWEFKDGTVWEVKQEEHSTIDHFITYSIITAEPSLTFTSALATIRLFAITTGKDEGSTFIQWSGLFSSDADAGVIEDARFKRKEALSDLAKAVQKK